MEVDFGVWGVVRRVAVVLCAIAILGLLALWYVPVINSGHALQKEIEIKREALRKANELNAQLNDQIHALRHDPEAVEREARKRLNLVKPNETIFHFESSKSNR
jgi:cell division protein FtsB